MLFRLALALGKTVAELRATLSYAEFQEWCLFYQVEPWGESRADLRAGIVASTVANVWSLWTTGKAEHAAGDFMPYLDTAGPEPQPVDEQELSDEELAAWADSAIFGIPPSC